MCRQLTIFDQITFMNRHSVTGIILSGGKSSRMGTEKGLVQYRDRKLIEFSLQMIKSFCHEIFISANTEEYKTLGYPVIFDEIKNIGPLGGIYSCVKLAKNEKVFVTACDIPEFDSMILQSMFQISTKADIVYLKLPTGRIQSLPLVLSKKILNTIELQINKKQYALRDLISKSVDTTGIKSCDLSISKEPRNINTLNDLNNA